MFTSPFRRYLSLLACLLVLGSALIIWLTDAEWSALGYLLGLETVALLPSLISLKLYPQPVLAGLLIVGYGLTHALILYTLATGSDPQTPLAIPVFLFYWLLISSVLGAVGLVIKTFKQA